MEALGNQAEYSLKTRLALAQVQADVFDPMGRAGGDELHGYLLDLYDIPHELDEFNVVINDSIDLEAYNNNYVPSILQDGVDAGVLRVGRHAIEFKTRNPFFPSVARVKVPFSELGPTISDRVVATRDRASDMAYQLLTDVPRGLPPTIRPVTTAEAIANFSYGDKMRKNGRPYYSHPLEVAAITNHVIDQINDEGQSVDDQTRGELVVVSFLHDAVEEWLKSSKHYSNDRHQQAITPLTVNFAMQRSGMRRSRASAVANSIRLSTHERTGGWMATYMEYVARLGTDEQAALVKDVDMLHNFAIDPKPLPGKRTPDESYADLERHIEKWRNHKLEYAYLVYDGGLLRIESDADFGLKPEQSRNIFAIKGDGWWGRAFYEAVRRQAIPKGVENLPEYTDKSIPTGSEYAAHVLPGLVTQLKKQYYLPDRNAA